MRIYIEHQYDPRLNEIRLLATTGFGEQAYRTAAPAVNEAEAATALNSFIKMYEDSGATVVR